MDEIGHPEFKSEAYDVSHIPDEQIKGEILLRVHLLTQKYAGTPQLFEKLHDILLLLLKLDEESRITNGQTRQG